MHSRVLTKFWGNLSNRFDHCDLSTCAVLYPGGSSICFSIDYGWEMSTGITSRIVVERDVDIGRVFFYISDFQKSSFVTNRILLP